MTGEEFRAARWALGISQADMARAVGLGAPARVSEIERGVIRVTPTMAILVTLLVERRRAGLATNTTPPHPGE